MITDFSFALAKTLRLQCEVILPENTKILPEMALDGFFAKGLLPTFINPSPDNDSLLIEYYGDAVYYLLEFHTDGEIVLLRRKDRTVDAWDLTAETFEAKLAFVISCDPEQVRSGYQSAS